MPHNPVRHCTTCNTLRYNDCKIGCAAGDAGNKDSWIGIEEGRDKVEPKRITQRLRNSGPKNGGFNPAGKLHPQVATSQPDTYVDEGIHKLIEALWDAGMETQSSCQGDVDNAKEFTAHVVFAYIADAYYFLTETIDRLDKAGRGHLLVGNRMNLGPMVPMPDRGLPGLRAAVEFDPFYLSDVSDVWTTYPSIQ